MGQNRRQTPIKTQHQHPDLDDEQVLLRRLMDVGVDLTAAARLVAEHEASHMPRCLR